MVVLGNVWQQCHSNEGMLCYRYPVPHIRCILSAMHTAGSLGFFFVADEIIASWYSILPTVKFFSLAYSVRRDIVLNKWASSCSASIYPSYIAYINLFLLLTLMLALDCALRLFTCKADTKH